MARTLPISQARSRLLGLAEELRREPESGAIVVTRRGQPVLALLSWDLYESLTETLEILGDAELMAALKKSMAELRAGKTRSWASVKKSLGL